MMTPNPIAARDGSTRSRGRLRRFLSVPFRTGTYAKFLYLLLAFPLGIAYFTIVTVGLSVGIGTSVVLVGVPILLATIVGCAVLAALDARLTSALVGVDTALPETLRTDNSNGIRRVENGPREVLVDLLTAPTTWGALVLLLVKFVYGIVAFVVLTGTISLTGALLAAPFVYDASGVTYTIGTYAVGSLPGALGVSVLGVVVGIGSVYLLNGVALVGGYVTAALLGFDRGSEAAG